MFTEQILIVLTTKLLYVLRNEKEITTKTAYNFFQGMVLKLGRFGQQIRNTWKVSKCGAGGGWRRSVGPIM